MSIILKRPLTEKQKQAVANRDKPPEQAQIQAMKEVVDYVVIKLGELEEKQNGSLPTLQSK